MNIEVGQAYSFSQVGLRDNQEDCRYPNSDLPQLGQRFFIVCDGVGGSAKGEVASHTVCDYIGNALAYEELGNIYFDNERFGKLLDGAYDALDKMTDDTNRGMATTLTFVCLHQGGCMMAHIGDSRIYHIRPGEGIIYRSEDHSLVNAMVHSGLITPEEAVDHPQSNIITRCMESVDADQNRSAATVMLTTDIQAGDYIFLCSDGVTQMMSDEEIVATLEQPTPDVQKMEYIAHTCINSSDNNTATLIPIIGVERDDDDLIDRLIEKDNTSLTRKIKKRSQSISEVESVQKGKRSNVFTKMLKNLFRR